jgi:hypothetical protein
VRPALSIFLKAPRMGTVKTRLAAEIGERHALRLYRVMAARTLAAAREAGLEASIWFTPADAVPEMRHWLGAEYVMRPQASGDLGARLATAAHAVEPGRVWIAVGADCPRLDAALLRDAVAVLAEVAVVLGPTVDGGYYLVGGVAPLPDIFSDMPWSTERLLEATRARLTAADVAWRELGTLRDVDTAADAKAEGLLT